MEITLDTILGILGLGALGWFAFNHFWPQSSKAPQPVEEIAPPVAPAEPLSSESLPAPLTQMQEVAAAPEDQPATDMSVNATSADGLNATDDAPAVTVGEAPVGLDSSEQTEQVVEAAPVAQAQESVAAEAPAKERTLRIDADSASWLQARPDDQVLDYFLRKGESTTVTFTKSLSVKFGNAGGVRLELDGQPYPFEGAQGEVKTLVVD